MSLSELICIYLAIGVVVGCVNFYLLFCTDFWNNGKHTEELEKLNEALDTADRTPVGSVWILAFGAVLNCAISAFTWPYDLYEIIKNIF